MDELGKQIQLEALITERAKMVARSRYHVVYGLNDAKRDDEFDVLAGKMRQLLKARPGAWLSLEQLEQIEWGNGVSGCIVCSSIESSDHDPDCWLGAKIKEALQGKG